MTAIKTKHIRSFNANQFLNIFATPQYKEWQSGENITINDIRIYNNYKYIATVTGTTGITPPTHTSGEASDGGIIWLSVEQYYRNSYFHNSVYLSFGRNTDWSSEPIPETPIDNDQQYITFKDIVSLKKITQSNARLAIQKNSWVSGNTYSHYDPSNTLSEYTYPYYVLNSENNIYKCIWNNYGSVSTSEPTGVIVNDYTYTADKYIWKYMGSTDSTDALNFTTTNYIAVQYKTVDDGTEQWDVQLNAKQQSISHIKVVDGGTGYSSATINITGDGTGANATAQIVGGVIDTITLTNVGQDYTSTPTIEITGDGTGATAQAIMAPLKGHGHNLPVELNAKDVILSITLEGEEGGYFPVTSPDNDFRQISMLLDPIDDATNDIATKTRYIGPAHNDYSQASGKNEIKLLSGYLIHIDNREAFIRDGAIQEKIRIILNF